MEPTTHARTALVRLRADTGVMERLADRFRLRLVVAFGSAVRDGEPADLDLAVAGEGPVDALALMEALYAVTGYERFDVLDLHRANVVARLEALRDGEALLERPAGEHNEELVQALTQFWDTQWLRDLELEALSR